MKTARERNKLYLTIGCGVLLGLSLPIAFVVLDLKQLGLSFNATNMYEVFKSQNIYFFSTILFPLLFGTVGALLINSFSQNKKLASQERYIKSVLNSLTDCILVCGPDGIIQYANNVYGGVYKDEIKSLDKLLNISSLKDIRLGIFFESSLLNRRGEKRAVSYIVHKLQNTGTSNINDDFFIVSIRDIEDLKRNEEIIESQKVQLFEASKLSSLGQMASGFAHEINNPLAIINGKITMTEREIKKDELDKEIILRNLETCKKTVGRITKIISGLRNLSHTKEGEAEYIAIKDLIEDAIIMANLKMSGKGIDFKINVEPVKDEKIFCNAIQVSQVLVNLFSNAIDAIEDSEGPWISLAIQDLGKNIVFTIMDSGKGIPLEVQKKMFDPMYTTKAIGKGSGLGLSISKSIIEKHEGKLILRNDLPNTCFEIILPKEISIRNVA